MRSEPLRPRSPHFRTATGLPCGAFPGTAEFVNDGVSTPEVTSITKRGTRSVDLVAPGGSAATLEPEETTTPGAAVADQPLAGTWTARQDLESGEGCPRPFELVQRPDPPGPPPVCLRFESSCPESDACS
ncbi:MAG: hypothetical protein DWQ36_07330 [Acidobacteria bacterium]|nr:MAG: hypothetical protein DWQ30_23270 [Acidobacteriota bacterium]REK09350.1 MAG: hypothetical protein DWQ36_07330 [Acidobacteriota bacterium]